MSGLQLTEEQLQEQQELVDSADETHRILVSGIQGTFDALCSLGYKVKVGSERYGQSAFVSLCSFSLSTAKRAIECADNFEAIQGILDAAKRDGETVSVVKAIQEVRKSKGSEAKPEADEESSGDKVGDEEKPKSEEGKSEEGQEEGDGTGGSQEKESSEQGSGEKAKPDGPIQAVVTRRSEVEQAIAQTKAAVDEILKKLRSAKKAVRKFKEDELCQEVLESNARHIANVIDTAIGSLKMSTPVQCCDDCAGDGCVHCGNHGYLEDGRAN